ncbi:MAG: TonB-dependent receptor [Deltaproteobacteria bacterium]|nr:TonB-dependent receptor [Deltaproteobacteria bacterium]
MMTLTRPRAWILALAISSLAAPSGLRAQEEPPPEEAIDEYMAMSLENLLDLQVTVATKLAKSARESPGVITVITREELLDAGARDLIDVMQLVPGFSPGTDVEGVVGLGFRGTWGFEGKVLLLLDGLEMNERAYANLFLGNHYPIEAIERIEIIRGPGSVVYGGFAELGVINVVTRSADDFRGISLTGHYGLMERSFGRRTLSLTAAEKFGELGVSLSAYLGQGTRSNGTVETFYGESYEMDPVNSALDPAMVNLGLTYKGLKLRYILDGYRTTNRIGFGDELAPEALHNDLTGHYAGVSYDWRLLEGRMVITPQFQFKRVRPWYQPEELDLDVYASAAYTFIDQTYTTWSGGVTAAYDLREGLNLMLGVQGLFDQAIANSPGPDGLNLFGDGEEVTYFSVAGFGQILWDNPWVNVAAGVRYENHSATRASLVPRLGLNKVVGPWHIKFQAAQSFRTPAVQQFELGVTELPTPTTPDEEIAWGIDPEKATVFELETGYRITQQLYAGINLFDTTLQDPIVYYYDFDRDEEFYANQGQTGSRGVEAELRFQHPVVKAHLTYSFYAEAGKNEVASYAVDGEKGPLLGFPQHKVTLLARVTPIEGLNVSASLIFMSERFAYTSVDASDELVLGREDPTLLLNLYARYAIPGVEGLEVGVGAYDLLGSGYRYVQPYDGYHAPYPAPTREFVGKIGYTLRFD